MNSNKSRQIRDILLLLLALLFCVLYIPHFIVYMIRSDKRVIINTDLNRFKTQISIKLNNCLLLLFLLHNNRYFRNIFYYRIGIVASLLIGWYRKQDRYFIIPSSTVIGKGLLVAHPYSTVLNAEIIGDNFTCLHCTTIGKSNGKRPIIGNNVTLGAHSVVIGGIRIGDNVTIGAGTVVVKDVPDNCVVVGSPARIINKTL